MKTFLDAWLLEAPMAFSQELSGMVKLVVAEPMREVAEVLSCQVEVRGALRGSFWIVIDADGLSRLLIAAHVTADEPDRSRDTELWHGMIRQAAERAAKSAGREAGAAVSVSSVQGAPRPEGKGLAFYEIRFGETAVRIAFGDQTFAAPVAKMKPQTEPSSPIRGIDLLLDVELDASLRFGSREMPLSEVLELGPGDVVQLERHVTDPVDLLVGDKIVARGEVVLVNGSFGLRVTEVAEPRKSLESIRCLF